MFEKNFPFFLDAILQSFVNDYNQIKSVDSLKSIVFKKEHSKKYNKKPSNANLDRLAKEVIHDSNYLIYALNFLQQEELIVYDNSKYNNVDSITITSKGYFKIKTEGFSRKIKNDRINVYLQRSVWLSALFSVILSFCTYFIRTKNACSDISKISINCSCNTQPKSIPNKYLKQKK